MAERRGRMREADTVRAISTLGGFNIATANPPDQTGYNDVLDMARQERLTVYDALYLWQALRNGSSLATRDADLIGAAGRRAVTVIDIRG